MREGGREGGRRETRHELVQEKLAANLIQFRVGHVALALGLAADTCQA